MITVRIKMGRIFPLCISSGVYLGVIIKYIKVPPIGMNNGWNTYEIS
tara:strand:+ start:805 stop:945 length:141 start_codon:yes stop_codon:yes gene_type:complete